MKNFICTLAKLALFLDYIHQLFYKRSSCTVNIEGTDRTAEGQLIRNNVADGSAVYETTEQVRISVGATYFMRIILIWL